MRPGQQNKRGRGRNNNNSGNNGNNGGRKGGNPLSRTYDSSGPDVKIRGTAQHIAEKYMNLARDAQSSGDNVMAENYLQHAEHYNRIVAAAQAQMQERFQRDDRESGDRDGYGDRDERDGDPATAEQPHVRQQVHANQGHQNRGNGNGNGHDRQAERDQDDEDAAAETAHASANGSAAGGHASPAHVNGSGPQPVIEGTPAELAIDEGQAASSRRAARPRRAAARPRRARKADEAGEGGEGAPDTKGEPGETPVAVASE